MERTYAFTRSEEDLSLFRRKLFSAWLTDMQQTDRYYDIVIRYIRADRPLILRPLKDHVQPGEMPLKEGDCLLSVSSAEPCEGVLAAAQEAFGEGCAGPFASPSASEGATVFNTITFKR